MKPKTRKGESDEAAQEINLRAEMLFIRAGIYPMRKNHKLDEWREFCQWIEQLPYSEIIIGKEVVELYADGKKVAEL